MGMLAAAASLLFLTALVSEAVGHGVNHRPPMVNCDKADYVFLLNLQRKDYAENPGVFNQTLVEFLSKISKMPAAGMGVGLVIYSDRVERIVHVSRTMTLDSGPLSHLISWHPKFNGIATGDALLAAKKLLAVYNLRLVEVGVTDRKSIAVAIVAGDTNKGHSRVFASSVALRKVAHNVFAVSVAGGASEKELYKISSDGTRGIFRVSSIVEAAAKTDQYAQVFCPCPLPWTNYDNCTIRGQAQVQKFFYNRTADLPHNCVLNSMMSVEQCDCPPNRVERSNCVDGVIRVFTIVYSRPNNNSNCTESLTTTTEPCGRASGCEAFVCPPGSQCTVGPNGTISCICTNPNDIFKVTGCEKCGDRLPFTSNGPCINGVRAVKTVTFFKTNDTICTNVISKSNESCSDCPTNSTRQYGPCVRGYQQMTLTTYELKEGRCYKNLHTLQVQCRLSSEYQCIGTVLSGGQYVTYDGQHIDFPGPCSYLLTERENQFQVRVQQAIKFPTLPYLTQIQSIVIIIGNVSYELTRDLVLKVSGVIQPLPYLQAANSVEAFYSDDAIVFSTGELYIQMRGSAATVSVRTNALALRGILGNCNGNLSDDYTDRNGQDVSQQTNRDTALGTSFQLTACVTTPCCPVPTSPACNTNTSLTAAALNNCGQLVADATTSFAHCGEAAMRPLLKSCVALFCRAQDNPAWQSSLVCSTIEAAAIRCYLQQTSYNRSSYPVFRTPTFCPKLCGRNAEFVNNADFCPQTCSRHFFSTQSLGCATPFGYKSRNAIGQAPVPGCQCKPGFVLDGGNCVPPNQCECLSDLCIDRDNRTVCESWKALGYCNMYPMQMRKFCKLTCEQCRVPCQDQINRETCQTVKMQGQCSDSFYRQMCQLTCNPVDCECPPCKTVRSPCDPVLKNRLVSTYCYTPDNSGHCQRNLTSSAYESCGICQNEQRSVNTRACDYCREEQVTRSTIRIREATGEMRCIETSVNGTTRSPGCQCSASSNRTVCYRNSELYVITTSFAPSADCVSCINTVTEDRLQNVTCPRSVQIGECDTKLTKRRRVTVTHGLVRNCQCDYITEEYEEMCVCPKPHWTKPICQRNREIMRWYLSFSLVQGRCLVVIKPHKQHVPCRPLSHKKHFCKGCARFEKRVWHKRRNCRCVRLHKVSRVGSCCCPKPSTQRGPCVGDQRTVTTIRYSLENNECQPINKVVQERCRCPPSKPVHECDRETGVVTLGKIVFKLIDGTCEEVRKVSSVKKKCKKMRVTRREKCRLLKPHATVKHRRVHYEVWERVEGTCNCRRTRRIKKVACGCREPQERLSKCPSDCPATSVGCPDHCRRSRAVIEFRFEDGRCQPEERDQEDLPCCCDKPRDKPPVCENDRILAIRKFKVTLVGKACRLKKYVVRTDVARHCNLKEVRRVRHGDLVIERHRSLQNCRCVWRERRKRCPAKCPRPKRVVRCDRATGERVVINYHYRLKSCRCHPVRQVRRMPVDCPEPKIERENRCSREDPAIVVIHTTYIVDDECRCKSKTKEQKFPCEQDNCKRQPTFRLICEEGQLYNVAMFHQKDEDGNCAPRVSRHKVDTPRCQGHGKKRYKKCIKGKTVLFERFLYTHNCRCQTKIRKRVIGQCEGHCKNRDRDKAPRIKHQCIRESNQLVTLRLLWRLEDERCVRKWFVIDKRSEPDCPSPRVRRLPCDQQTGKQKLERHEYTMHNCRCHGPKVSVTYRKCSCRGPKVLGRSCDARQGRIVVRMVIYKWNFDLDACHAKFVRKFIPIRCPHKNKMKHGPCRHGHMEFQNIRFIRNRQNCRCQKKVYRKKVNCHCPVIIRRGKCTHGHHVTVTTTIYRKFDTTKRRCVVVDQKRRHRRCRCPKARVKKTCEDGNILVQSVSYRLVNGECETDRSEERLAVACLKSLVIRTTDCNKNTCHKTILTYRWVVNPKNCRCRLKLMKKQFCRCCGCPVHQVHKKCIGDSTWKISITIHSVKLKTCSNTCRKHVNHHMERVRCSQRRRIYWTGCHQCRSRMVVSKYHSVKCRCVRKEIKTDRFRACCCNAATKLRKWCQQSTGLWVNQVKRLVLSGFTCIWQTSISYLPKPVCQLPETPVVIGICDRQTCLQNVTEIKNVLNKHTCSCELINVPARSRVCCCINPTPVTTFACIGDNVRQRTVVTPVFNEATRTCDLVTTVDSITISCGSGETRSPPCEGQQTRTISNIRSVAVNCECVNQTVSIRTELCVCPPPVNSTICDSTTGELILSQTTYSLIDGACPAKTVRQIIPVQCRTTPTFDYVCNNNTCTETVTKRWQELNNNTCSCIEKIELSTRLCCCPTTIQTRSQCVSNEMETVNTRSVLDYATRTCVPLELRTRDGKVPCVNETRVDLGCDPATRNRTIVITTYVVVNCVCQVVGTSVIKEICACPPGRSYIGPCNKATCLRRIKTVQFNLVQTLNGTYTCIEIASYTFRPCCCTAFGQKRVHVKVVCDQETGNLLVSKSWKKFNVTTEQCIELHKSDVKKIDCSGKFDGEDKLVHRGHCNRKNGLRTLTVKWYTIDTQKCQCKLHVRRINRVCSCKHKRRKTRNHCDHETNELVYTRRYFILREGACVPQEESTRQQVTCPEDRRVRESCNECNNEMVISYNVLSDCKCERKEVIEKSKCCCPESQFHRKCHNGRIKQTKVKFNLSADKKSCEKVENHRYNRIRCPRKRRLIKGKCNRRTCIALNRVVTFHLKHCKCKRRVRVKKRRCCCPKPKMRTRCHRSDTVVHERTNFKLRGGRCVAYVSIKKNRICCPEPNMVGKTPCNPETNKRYVKFLEFSVLDCHCTPRQIRRAELCACPKPRVVKQPCKGKKILHRVIYRIEFRRRLGDKCRPVKKLLYREPCYCPKPMHKKVCDPSGLAILQKSRTYRLITRYGRRICTHSERNRPQNIRCGKRSVRASRCHGGHRKIHTTEFHIRRCRCFRKHRVRRARCPKKVPRKYRKRICRKNRIIEITIVTDPETGEERKERKVKRVVCRGRPRTVQLSKGCKRRGDDNGLYRKVAIIRSILHDCKCKQKRRISWRLCRCKGVKRSQRCVHDVMEHIYEEEHRPYHGHCKSKRSRRTREHRCPKRPVEVKKTPCDRRSCRRRVLMTRCWMEHCQCRCLKRIGEELCCSRRPVRKQFCKDHHMHFIETKFRIRKIRVIARDSESGEDWHNNEVKPSTRRWSKKIVCPKPEVRQSCNRDTGVLKKRIIVFNDVKCKCKPRMRTVHTRCRCPTPETRLGRCVNGRRQMSHTSYHLDEDERCHKKHHNSWKPCGCPKPTRSVKCLRGRIHVCTITFNRHNGCRPKRHCVAKTVHCPPTSKKRHRCFEKTNKAKLIFTRFTVNRKTCQCDRNVVVQHVYCSCSHLNRKRRTCHGNVWVTVKINYLLQRGECLPDEAVTHNVVDCRDHRTEIMPNTCESRSGLSTSGTQVARTIISVPVDCHCKNKVRTYRVPCICSLIPKYKTTHKKVCSHNNQLITKITSFHLVHGKCLPRKEKKTTVVKCHGTRTRKTACLRSDLGDSFQYVLTIRKKAYRCRCRWLIERKVRVNCGCRPPTSQTTCVGNELLEKTTVYYGKPAEIGANCEPRADINTTIVNCSTPRVILEPCNTDTCFAKEITIKFEPKDCNCHAVYSFRYRQCCCPQPVVSPKECNPSTNQFEQVTSRYDLVNGTCVLVKNTIYQSVTCDTRSNDTFTSHCNTTTNLKTFSIRDLAVVNCQCVSSVRTSTQPCGCPDTQRFEQGLCNGTETFSTDKYYRQVFNSTTSTCVEVLFHSVQRPCLCNRQTTTMFCTGTSGNILRRVTYAEQLVNNTCVNVTFIDEMEVTCPNNGTSLVTRSDCAPGTNTRSSTVTNYLVVNCSCVSQNTRSEEPCNCFIRHGGRIETSICRPDNVTQRTVTYYYDGPGGICLQNNVTTEQRVTCTGVKEVRQDCNEDSGKIEIRVFQLVPIACKCEWVEQTTRYEDCICKKSHTKKLCEHDKHVYHTTYYELVDGECTKREQKSFVPVDCDKDGKQVEEKYEKCTDGARTVVKFVRRLHKCRCVTKRIRTRCSCHCPNSRTWNACKDNRIVIFRLFYNLVGCKCVKKLSVRENKAFCGKRRVERSACIRGHDGDGHVTVVTSHHRSINCRCQTEKREEREACECEPLENQERNCQGRTLIVVTTRRQVVDGSCQRVIVRTEARSVACPLQSIKCVSGCGKNGFRMLERTVWRAKDCNCVPEVRLVRQRCSPRCDMVPKIVKKSRCNKETCTQRLYYFFKNQKCRSKHFAITARCCCPRSRHGVKKCIGQTFEVRDLFYKLERGVCVMSATTYREEIGCQRRERFETATSATGNTIVFKTWHAVKDCKCLKIKVKTEVKHRECKNAEVKNECISEPEPRIVKIVTRYVKLTKHGACEKMEDVIEKPVGCPLDIVHLGPCHKNGKRNAYVRRVSRVTFRKVKCQCVEKRKVHFEVCQCFQSSVVTRCHRSSGVLLVNRRQYEVSPQGDTCLERCDVEKVQVNCDETWRAPRGEEYVANDDKEKREESDNEIHSRRKRDVTEDNDDEEVEGGKSSEDSEGRFTRVLEREVRVGCTCRVQRRRRSCRSRCPKKSVRVVCEGGRKKFRIVTTYKRCGPCRCSYRVRKIPLRVRMPSKKVKRCKCRACKQRVVTIEYRVQNCKAKRIRRVTSRKCCCKKKPRVSAHCRAGQMLVTQTRTEHLTKYGHCLPRYENSYKIVVCRRIINEKALSACVNGQRKWRRELEKLHQCSCKRAFQRITRPCGFKACKPPIVRFGLCINCASKETKTEFIYSSITNQCEAKRFHKIHNCCCAPPHTYKNCVGNRLLLITMRYRFQIKTGTCIKSERSKDITRSLYKECKESKRTTIGRCMENGFQVIVTLQPTLVECVCHKNQSIRFIRCRCESPAITEACVQNGTIKYRKVIHQELDGETCKNITDETYAQVECPLPSTTQGICDSTTCQRTITTTTYAVSDCACQRMITQRLEICCCPTAVNETRSCQRAENTLVVTRQYQDFDIQNRACVTRTRTDRSGVVCPQNYRSTASPCDQYRNNSFYRTVSDSITIVSGCECVAQTTTRTELCGCDAAQEFTECTPANQLLTYRIQYRPNANNTVCLPIRVDLSLRDVVCDGTERSTVPTCSNGTRSAATGETRITVVTSWQTRSNNCTCATQTRFEQILCACPENSKPKTICDKTRHEKVNVTTVYTLQVIGSIRQCIVSKVISRMGFVRCQSPVVQLGNCQFGLMSVKTVVHLVYGCKCIPKVYKHQQRCHKILKPCINKLPDYVCAELDIRHGICRRNFTNADSDPVLQQLADASALCDRECNRCDGCHSIGGQWQFKYADRECLVTETRYPRLAIKKDTGFKNCLKQCKADLSCRSFDFYLPSGQCTLAKVDRHGLHDHLMPRHHMVGALPSDNQHRGATRCNLYERICSLRVTTRLEDDQLGCPGRHVTAKDSHCRCQPVSLALGYFTYCYRTVTIAYFIRLSGKCYKRETYVRVPCRPCRDLLPVNKCRAIEALGGCSIGSSARRCPKTCRLCQCDGRELVNPGICNTQTGKREETVIRTEWVPGFRLCQVIVQKVTKKCLPCIVGLVIQPGPCIGNYRYVYYITTAFINGQCIQKVKRVRMPCHGCYAAVARQLGPCAGGHRSVDSIFAVKSGHGGPGDQCREEKASYKVGCADCPPPIVKTQPCINGKRLRQVRYYVRPPNSDQCLEARFETEDKCGTLCHDQISNPECDYQRHTGQCDWNFYTRRVCPSSCNRC